MWANLGSPPQNFRFYKYSESSLNQEDPLALPLPLNYLPLYQPPVYSGSHTQTHSLALQKQSNTTTIPLSSQPSITKTDNKHAKSSPKITTKKTSGMKLELSSKGKDSKSRLNIASQKGKRKEKEGLKQSYDKSSIKCLPSSLTLKSTSKNMDWEGLFGVSKKDVNNQQDLDDTFSQIFIKEMNKTEHKQQENSHKKATGKKQKCLYDMMITLREIKEIQEQNLNQNKKLVKLLERSHVECLRQSKGDKECQKTFKSKKDNQKSLKRQKSSIKRSATPYIQERMSKIEEKLKNIERKIEQQPLSKKLTLASKKKSQSTIR